MSDTAFEKCCSEAAKAEKNRLDTEYQEHYSEYGRLTKTQSDNANTIRRRHAFLSKEMLKLLSLKRLDEKREFSEFERNIEFICQGYSMMNGNAQSAKMSMVFFHRPNVRLASFGQLI